MFAEENGLEQGSTHFPQIQHPGNKKPFSFPTNYCVMFEYSCRQPNPTLPGNKQKAGPSESGTQAWSMLKGREKKELNKTLP